MRPGTLLRWYALKRTLESTLERDSILLDIGSYDGFIAHKLANIVPDLHATILDSDKSGLEEAKKKKLNVLCASATELPIGDNEVDVVFCLDLIEHINDDFKVIGEISRVLKSKGKVILTTPMVNGVSFPLLKRKKSLEINKNWGHVRLGYTLNQIKQLFESNNLILENTCGYFNLLTRIVYPFTALDFKSKSKKFIFESIIKLEPFIKYGIEEHIIVGEKI